MSQQLKMEEDEFGKEVGGYDPRTDFTGMNMSDEEIARKLQMAEYEPEVKHIGQEEDKGPSIEEKLALQQSYADAQHRNAENRIRNMERAQERHQREFQQALQSERQREREQLARAERERDEERNKRKALEDIATYANITRTTYPLLFDRIYNWGLTLVPNYYDYETRRLLREQLSKLIKRELLLHSTESELENKIRRLINDAEYDIMLKKESTEKKPASDTKKKPRAKSKKSTSSKATTSAKKSHKKKAQPRTKNR